MRITNVVVYDNCVFYSWSETEILKREGVTIARTTGLLCLVSRYEMESYDDFARRAGIWMKRYVGWKVNDSSPFQYDIVCA